MKPSANEILVLAAEQARERIISALGEDEVRAIFVTGSLPRGEIAWFNKGGKYEIYSDVDISVVVEDGAAWEEARSLARQAVNGVEREGRYFEMVRSIDVGVYLLKDLLSQPARPGTVDISRCHRLLHGDAEIPKMMEHICAASIDRSEGLYLLENRLMEKTELFERIRREQRDSLERYAVYAAHKSCADAGAAALIAANRYSSDARAREKSISGITGAAAGDFLLSEEDAARIEKSIRALSDFNRGLPDESESCENAWSNIEPFILAVWRRLCGRLLGRGGDAEWVSLIDERCRRGRTLENARSFARLARRRKSGRLSSLIKGAGYSQFSPVDALRLSGLVQCALNDAKTDVDDAALSGEFIPYLDRITTALGCGDGDIFTRARMLYNEVN